MQAPLHVLELGRGNAGHGALGQPRLEHHAQLVEIADALVGEGNNLPVSVLHLAQQAGRLGPDEKLVGDCATDGIVAGKRQLVHPRAAEDRAVDETALEVVVEALPSIAADDPGRIAAEVEHLGGDRDACRGRAFVADNHAAAVEAVHHPFPLQLRDGLADGRAGGPKDRGEQAFGQDGAGRHAPSRNCRLHGFLDQEIGRTLALDHAVPAIR